ncbi:hypothetical protein EI94DRAFT_1731571 [Lactarius quietus]|nr:hypothetical protein EI94DRAFT_1731571 [Lactarius quietus]
MTDNIDTLPTTTGDILPPQSSSRTLPKPSPLEAKYYYIGLSSKPILVARTGTPWVVPTGPDADWERRELRVIGNHPLHEAWEGGLVRKVIALLDSMEVKFTSIDVIRMGIHDEYGAPAVVWIGVKPSSLSGEDGVIVASRCRNLLVESDITDVDVEIRESEVHNLVLITEPAVPTRGRRGKGKRKR